MAPESTFCSLGTDLLLSQVMEGRSAFCNVHPYDLMALTDNSTAKLERTKSSPFIPWQASGFQSHLYSIVRLSTSLIPSLFINSTKRKSKNKIYFTICKDLSSIAFIINKLLTLLPLHRCRSSQFHCTHELAFLRTTTPEQNMGWWFGVFVLVWFYFVISVWMCFPVPEEQKWKEWSF